MKKTLGMFLAAGILATSLVSTPVIAAAEDIVQEPIKVEYETLAVGTATQCSGASGGQVLVVDSTSRPTISVPVSISKAGYYEITYVVGAKASTNSQINFTINVNVAGDFEIPCNNSDTPSVAADYTGPSGWTMKKFTRKSVWIEPNEYEIFANLSAANSKYSACLDYIEVKPTTPPRILPSAPTRIELDDYDHLGVGRIQRLVVADKEASGGYYTVEKQAGGAPYTKTIPVVIEKSGYYHVEAIASARRSDGKYNKWRSLMEYKLDDLLLLNNDGDTEKMLGYTAYGANTAGLFKANWVWLPAGEHNLKIIVYDKDDDSSDEPPYVNYQYDYIEFTPAANGITMENGEIKVHASYLDAATGRAIMAAYNERNELVGSVGYDVSSKPYVNFSLKVNQPVAKVKVFLWDSIENIAPLEIEKEFDLTS